MHLSVEAQSALDEKFLISDRPSAIAERIAARWEIDLSPGNFRFPASFSIFLILTVFILERFCPLCLDSLSRSD
jgi:hypothetical protein